MSDPVQLIGLDFGTTTSSAVIATARLRSNSVTARMELDDVREQFRSERVFTPYRGDLLDEPRLEAHLDAWLEAGLSSPQLFGGGALLTGLTAKAANASSMVSVMMIVVLV
jgi:ethanolamine utilization protein EutA